MNPDRISFKVQLDEIDCSAAEIARVLGNYFGVDIDVEEINPDLNEN